MGSLGIKHPSSRVLSALMRLSEPLSLPAGRWEAVPWIKASAYGLFGLPVPWQLPNGEIDADFRTSESGQMLFNRRDHLQQHAAGIITSTLMCQRNLRSR